MVVLICADRDGTITKDENYYLGKDSNWKEQVELLPGVIKGGKLLNSIPNSHFFILTNQGPVGIKEFEELTEERVHEVNDYVVDLLASKGVIVEECFAAFYADKKFFAKYKKKGFTIDKKYLVKKAEDRKPNIGMVEKAAKRASSHLEDEHTYVYVIGDRDIDVKTALNCGGVGILVPTFKTTERGDEAKVKKLEKKHPGQVVILESFSKAAEWIVKDLKKKEKEGNKKAEKNKA